MPLILLDRDGTLIEEGDYLTDPKLVKLIPGAVCGLKRLKAAGFRVVVVTNQSGVGRGLITLDQLKRVNRRFLFLLRRQKAAIDGLYWCPHAPSARCGCRKPRLGMVKQAAKELACGWRGAISVGDRPSDVALGQKTGGFGILVLTGYGSRWVDRDELTRPNFVAKDFSEAVRWIIRNRR